MYRIDWGWVVSHTLSSLFLGLWLGWQAGLFMWFLLNLAGIALRDFK